MKRFFALFVLVLLACSPVAAFAADKAPPAGERTDQSGGGDQSGEDGKKNDKSDASASGDEEIEVIDKFAIGMDKKGGEAAGAKPTDDPDTLVLTLSWKDAEWKTALMYKDDTMITMAMQTAIDNKVLMGVLGYMKDQNYKPMLVMNVGGKEIFFYKRKAEGEGDDALEAAFDKELEDFADADEGEFIAVFCFEETLDALTDAAKKKINDEESMKKEGDSVVYVLNLDKKDDDMVLMMSTLESINAQ